ncbi:hypothetical protein HYS42_01075 [Candidatus Saccharibacteria bacterium]|nr:hypothetical protein [Candidatus Saccharibacteria bacterium]
MQIQDDDLKNGVILEEIRDQNKAIIEGLKGFSGVPAKVDKLSDDMEIVKSDLKVIKAVVKDHSNQLDDHEHRIAILEAT